MSRSPPRSPLFPYTTLFRSLQEYPTKGSLPEAVPVDPLIYRFHEITQVYGTTMKALIHEMFGDGIMSAIDFEMYIEKVDRKSTRLNSSHITISYAVFCLKKK